MSIGDYIREGYLWHRKCAELIDTISSTFAGASTGSSNAYVISPTIVHTRLVDGESFRFIPNFTNTGAATLQVSSLAAKDIKRANGSTALSAGDIISGTAIEVQYDSSADDFRLISPLPVFTISTEDGYGAGTAYTLTTTPALIDLGTTDPFEALAAAAPYLLFAGATVKYNGATYAANQTVTVKLRRTTATAADIPNATTTQTLEIITTGTKSFQVTLPVVVYTPETANVTIEVFASVSALPSAGTMEITESYILAVRIA